MTEQNEILANFITTHPEARVNEDGDIALRCIRERPQIYIDNCPSKRQYVAITQVGICLVWVDPRDADFIIEHKKMGCCGKSSKVFQLANETEVRRWTNKGGR